MVSLLTLAYLTTGLSFSRGAVPNNQLVVPTPNVEPYEQCSCECNYAGTKKEKCSWIILFKAVEGSNRHVHKDYITPGNINPNCDEALDITTRSPYRNGDVLDRWEEYNIRRIKIDLFKNDVREVWFLFDAYNTNFLSWMDEHRLLDSSYYNLKSEVYDFFSVDGYDLKSRRFFINPKFGCCEYQCTYLVVVDKAGSHECKWEMYQDHPYFIYSGDKTGCANQTADFEVADRFVISAQMCESHR